MMESSRDSVLAAGQWRKSTTAKKLVVIASDALITLVLLGALSLVHLALNYTPVTEDFKALFGSVHEKVVLGTYLLLAGKGLLRIAKDERDPSLRRADAKGSRLPVLVLGRDGSKNLFISLLRQNHTSHVITYQDGYHP